MLTILRNQLRGTAASLNFTVESMKSSTAAVLRWLGANAVGSRSELTGETNRTRNWPSVTFAADDVVTPATAFILTTLLSMM